MEHENKKTDLDKTYYPDIKQSFGLIFKLFLISIPVSIPLVFLLIPFRNSQYVDLVKSLIIMISFVVTLIILIRITKSKILNQGMWTVEWRKNKVPFKAIIIFIIMTLAIMIIIAPLTELIPMPESIVKMFEEMMKPNIFSFIFVVIAAPILEELFFRGIILEGLLKSYSVNKAIFWSAIIFGTAHFNPWQTIGASLAGILIGWAYVRTKSLIPGMIIHATNNLIGFVVMAKTNNATFYLSDIFENKIVFYSLLITSILVLFLGMKFINRLFYKNNYA